MGWFTYYYLGYLLGNNIVVIKSSTRKLICLWIMSIFLQVIEGYWYRSMGETNCGTQLKLSAILTGTLFVLMAYRFINSGQLFRVSFLRMLGDYSFGIYFSLLTVMSVLGRILFYSQYACYPINAIIAILVSLGCVRIGNKALGKYGKYLAL